MKTVALDTARREPSRLAASGDEPDNRALYEEYVRGFDDVPVLDDAVRIPPRRAGQPSFRDGERRDLRKDARHDGYLLREARLAVLERLYDEYDAPRVVAVANAPKRKRKNRPKKSKKR